MTFSLSIQREAPDSPEALALLGELDSHLYDRYLPADRHGLSVEALRDPSVVFLIARSDGKAIGCGALRFAGDEYAEVKRMYVTPSWRGRGVARALLGHLEGLARQRGLRVLRLETGVHQPEAIRLYERAGFFRCGLFGEYANASVSVCFEKSLAPTGDGLSP